MKSKKKQRILALILSMVLMLSASISALAQGDVQTEASGTETTENQAAAQSLGEETVPETETPAEEAGIATQSAEITEESVEQETADQNTAEQGTTEQNTAEQEPQTQENPEVSAQTQEASAEAAGTVQEGTSAAADNSQENTSAAETAPESEVQNTETQNAETQEEASVSEEQPAETTEETVTEETVVSEATELKQEFTDEDGNVTQTVTAYVPEGAFQAAKDQISMEVKLLNEEDANYIKGMMEEKLPEGFYLDGYVLYQIDFKVNGEITKPAKAITISMTGNELAVEDTKNAHVFYYVPEDPEVEGDEDQLTEVTQKDQLIKSLEESGQSTENIEDYDYSEIAVNEGNADSITVKGWESTIYGCYVEKEMAQEVTYEDDTVKVTVSADEKGIIPNKTTLQVVPISNSGDTKDQYKEVEKKLQEKAESEEYEIAGFLAYDISFVDKEGKEVEPDGEVRVSLEYKNAALPEGLTEEEAKDAEVSMLHLEEDEKGEVKDVVDMAEKEQVEAIATTESQQVEKVAVKTESFSTFTITWTYDSWNKFTITANYVYADENGKFHSLDVSQANVTLGNNQTIDVSKDSSYVKEIPGYTYQYTSVDKENGDKISELQTSSETTTIPFIGSITNYYIKYLQEGSEEPTDWLYTASIGRDNTDGTIYFVYQEVTTGLKIVDNIIENGTFDAEYTSENDEKVVSYKWYRSDSEDGEYKEVEQVYYENGASNLSENGSSLYPAYDEGARKWYKVEVTLNNGKTVISEPLRVPYYDELQNGSFENPAYRKYNKFTSSDTPVTMTQTSNEEYKEEGVWQTTGTGAGDKDIEILGVGEIIDKYGTDGLEEYYAWQKDQTPQAADGVQFAELNCETAGALYQDVLTVPGEPLNYYLSHRARGNNNREEEFDTMFLVIMPTKDSQDLTTQDELEDELKGLGVDINEYSTKNEAEQIVYQQDGILVVRITSDDQDWHDIEGIAGYTPTSSMTRFFFMAGKTAASIAHQDNGVTVGNFLDAVWFSQDLPPVADDEFSLVISKDFEGLDSTTIEKVRNNIQFKISADGMSDDEVAELLGLDSNVIKGIEMNLGVDQSLTYSIANRKIGVDKTYNITITESNAQLDGYSMSSEVQTKVTVGDQKPVESQNPTFTLQGETIAEVAFTNTYDRSEDKKVNFEKIWDDGNHTEARPESLSVTLKPSVYLEQDGTLVEQELTSEQLGGIVLTKTITAADNWKTSWEVPVYYEYDGAKVKIEYTVVEGEIDGNYVYEANSAEGIPYDGKDTGYTSQFDTSEITSPTETNTIAAKTRSAAPEAEQKETDDLGEPIHSKYIEYNRNTGDYTLNLDILGGQGEAKGVDVLFVIDTSGSMGSGWGNNNLLPEVKDLLTDTGGIIDQIFAADGNVNSVAYVSFAGMDETQSSGWYQEGTAGALKQRINSLRATGGTNWTYAMQRAERVLEQRANNDNEKVVIFLSDGEPTYSINDRGYEYGWGSSTSKDYYTEAISEVTGSDYLQQAQIYSVYLTKGTKSGMETFADGTGATLIDGTDLAKALEDILKIIIPTYQNVVIKDTLSEYVDFVDEEITVTATSADGTETTLEPEDYTARITGDNIEVQLLNGDSLQAGTTYTVSFKVKPNELANEEYAEEGYLHEGDPGTGTTSAGQQGFYSNKEGSAVVTYEVNGEPGSADYQRPVVQVTTHTLTFTKTWNQPESVDTPVDKIILDAYFTDGTHQQITLSEEEKWTAILEDVPVTREIAYVEEKDVPENYEPSYQYSTDGTSVNVINNYTKLDTENIEVTKVWKGGGAESSIEVVLYQSVNGESATQYGDSVTLSEENDWTYTWKDLPLKNTVGGDVEEEYTYAVREVNTPAGYRSSISYQYGKNKTTATITNTYDSNCADENFYIANVLQTDKLSVSKTWEDNDDALELRPSSITINIEDGQGAKYIVDLDESNSWQKTITVLKKKNVRYTATEQYESEYYSEDENARHIEQTENGAEISFVNKLESKTIVVKKDWVDGWDETPEKRPGNISFTLKYREDSSDDWKPYGDRTYNLTAENMIYDENGDLITNWAMEISNLPVNYEYTVVEEPTAQGYHSKVSSSADGLTFAITNTLNWSLKKTDLPEDGKEAIALSGAKFELASEEEPNTVIAEGTSGTDGMISWVDPETKDEKDLSNLKGNYILTETEAPSGYQILKTSWTLTFENGLLKDAKGENNNYNTYISITSDAENGVVLTLKNGKLYELPETGGPGIFLYMIGGTLLLMAGSLMIYINRRRGVLKK